MKYYKLKRRTWIDNINFFTSVNIKPDDTFHIEKLSQTDTFCKVINEDGAFFKTSYPDQYLIEVEGTAKELGKW